jgi:hypothetical protein
METQQKVADDSPDGQAGNWAEEGSGEPGGANEEQETPSTQPSSAKHGQPPLWSRRW